MRLFGGLIVASLALTATAMAQPRPNLLVIMTDDQGTESIEGTHWSNEMDVATPVLKRWADQGVSFTQCRVNPNCSPTRAAMLTGRSALDTGVAGALSLEMGRWVQDVFALQQHERTVAEVLNELDVDAYHTILMDKWHVGYNAPHTPLEQGFDAFYSRHDYLPLDQPETTGDEHISTMVDLAVAEVSNRPPNAPYALFFHSINPHRREEFDPECIWWKVSDDLLDRTKHLSDDCGINRFKRILEATDTELGRMLRELGVTDAGTDRYIPDSNTIVIFVSDNGTDYLVSSFGVKAKNSLFEGGVNVPLFAFGAGITGNSLLEGTADSRQVSHVDFYDTICDIVDASPSERGDVARRGLSFADSLGWESGPLPRREYTLCSLSHPEPELHEVALIGDPTNPGGSRYKLIARGGGEGFGDLAFDSFYDLEADPTETVKLLDSAMTEEQIEIYYEMRDVLVDHWATAVGEPNNPADLPRYSVTRETDGVCLIVYIQDDVLLASTNDEFYDLVTDPARENNLVGGSMAAFHRVRYQTMRFAVEQQFLRGEVAPNGHVVTIPSAEILALNSDQSPALSPFALGYADYGEEAQVESRAFIRFDVSQVGRMIPPGYTFGDVVAAQLIMQFDRDEESSDVNPASEGVDTGPLRVHRVTGDWSNHLRLWSDYDPSSQLGVLDLPPNIVPDPEDEIRGLPLPPGAPVSFGHSTGLLEVLFRWHQFPSTNHGLVLVADPVTDLNSPRENDQHVYFLNNAQIRLTLRR